MQVLPHEKEIQEYIKTISHLKTQSQGKPLFNKEIQRLEQKLEKLKKEVYTKLTPWQRVQISRHPNRPRSLSYIREIFTDFEELSGDRQFANDPSLIGGFARIHDTPCLVIAQEKGGDTESRLKHNFGMMNPEGYRKALRLMKLAEKFQLPIVSLIDTPGAYPGLGAEERGQGWAIAENLKQMSQLKTAIIAVIIGEGCSGGALGIGIADATGMLEHSYYSVISPESCASILFKDANKKVEASSLLKLTAEDMLDLQIVDEIIPEPLGGAHHDKEMTNRHVSQFINEKLSVLRHLPADFLIEQRYLKFRKFGSILS